jgi:NAD(P)-dependent dehydrogenase (short-subunit alcohol dehydrogenase family)
LAIAHFGPFLFTKLVASKLLASTTPQFIPRVIDVSSAVPQVWGDGLDFEAFVQPSAEKYNAFDGYRQSKAASTLAALELARRAKGKISSYSLSPGSKYCLNFNNLGTDRMFKQ